MYRTITRVADPDPGSGAFLTPGCGIEKQSESVSGMFMSIPDNFFENLETVFRFKNT
jgi:hypothetical protein